MAAVVPWGGAVLGGSRHLAGNLTCADAAVARRAKERQEALDAEPCRAKSGRSTLTLQSCPRQSSDAASDLGPARCARL